ncbi:Pre-mRNA-splicing factor ISY1-like [Lamellibrachia satsuma]|nr:Pre-mRNA-splicing factor ISY1-like [Lamellibrachia satsuma]
MLKSWVAYYTWTALARWRASQVESTGPDRRPYLATECDNLQQAEKWRRQIIGEVSRKVAQIQNAGLGEFKLRDLNDEINKLLREKGHWEDRIQELGGPNYRKIGPKMLDHEGKEVPGNKGYKYFGAAKDLPGVQELFQQAPPPIPRKTRAEMMKNIDADYYGYRDEDDGILVPHEQEVEKEAILSKVAEWKAHKEALLSGDVSQGMEPAEEVDIYAVKETDEDEEKEEKTEEATEGLAAHFIAHVPVPSQKEVEEALVQRKKMELLQKYASDSLQAQTDDVKDLLGV